MSDDFELTPVDGDPKKPKHGPSKPMQRSLEHLRKQGWQVGIVERRIPPRPPVIPYGRTIDVWGFGDILACRPRLWVDDDGFLSEEPLPGRKVIPGVTALIQTTTGHGGSMAEHHEKILALTITDEKTGETKPNPVRIAFLKWKNAGNKVFLHGWRYGGARGERKRWILREIEL